MGYPWFKKLGWLYRPTAIAGWLITVVALGLCVWIFLAVDRNSHSVSDTLIGTFPYATLFVIIWIWIASNTAKTSDTRP